MSDPPLLIVVSPAPPCPISNVVPIGGAEGKKTALALALVIKIVCPESAVVKVSEVDVST